MDRDDVRMHEARGQPGLGLKPFRRVRRHQILAQQFGGHRPLERRVERRIHGPHPATPDPAIQPIAAGKQTAR